MSRKKIPTMLVKRVFQEAASCCSFCNEQDVAALEIHHIDEDPNHNELENLLLVCSSCHSKITHGDVSPADVILQKRIIQFQAKSNHGASTEKSQTVNVSNTNNSGVIANVVNIKGKKSPKMNYPDSAIGADTIRKGYIDYLYGRYLEFRKADKSFCAHSHSRKFLPGELHTTIAKKFKAKTFFIHESRFEELVEYMHGRIDKTILGKRNLSRGTKNYSSFQEYQAEQTCNGQPQDGSGQPPTRPEFE